MPDNILYHSLKIGHNGRHESGPRQPSGHTSNRARRRGAGGDRRAGLARRPRLRRILHRQHPQPEHSQGLLPSRLRIHRLVRRRPPWSACTDCRVDQRSSWLQHSCRPHWSRQSSTTRSRQRRSAGIENGSRVCRRATLSGLAGGGADGNKQRRGCPTHDYPIHLLPRSLRLTVRGGWRRRGLSGSLTVTRDSRPSATWDSDQLGTQERVSPSRLAL